MRKLSQRKQTPALHVAHSDATLAWLKCASYCRVASQRRSAGAKENIKRW